jgi:hypothetical protein
VRVLTGESGERATRNGLVVVGFLALAVLTTWPLILHLTDHVVGHAPREATPALNIWSMAWAVHQFPRDPAGLFEANSFYPYARTLAFSEHLFIPALMAAPLALATGNWVLAYNVLTLFTLVLAAWAMFKLARYITGDSLAAFGAGALYAFYTWNVNEIVRLQILSNAWFPLLLLALLRYFDAPSASAAWRVALLYTLQSLSCMYWALYAPLLVVLAIVALQLFRRLAGRQLAVLGLSLIPPLLVVALFVVPYVRVSRELGFERSVPNPLPMERYLAVLPGNLLYGGALQTGGPNQGAAHFLGFIAVTLAVVGLWGRRAFRTAAGLRCLLVTLVLVGFILSLGPRIVIGQTQVAPGPYAALREWVPGFRNVRYPERFALFLMLGLAPAAALGLRRLRPWAGEAGTVALVVLLWLEHLAVPAYLDPLAGGAAIPEVYRRLRERSEVRVTADLPAYRHRLERFDALPMYHSTAHWKRSAEGFSGYFPPTYNFTKWRLLHFPKAESVAFLERFGVDTVVVRPEGVPRLLAAADAGWRVEGPFVGGHYLLRHPQARRAPSFDAVSGSAGALAEIPRTAWRVQASSPAAGKAVDGDPDTSWSTPEHQRQGEFFRVAFPEAVVVSRISVSVLEPYEFPMRLKLMGQDVGGTWSEIPFDEATAYDSLFGSLLSRPRNASLDLDIAPTMLQAFRLRITETDPFGMPWTMAELRAFSPR